MDMSGNTVIPISSAPSVANERFARVRLRSNGSRREPDVLIPGLILKSQTHIFYGASDTGKSWIVQSASKEAIQTGLPVLYFDLENGPNVMEERMLDVLGVSEEEEEDYFHYYPIELTTDDESQRWYLQQLESFPEAGLIVFDSLLGFLTLAGFGEDSSTDFEVVQTLRSGQGCIWTAHVIEAGHQWS
jgi:hypothetical protein